MQIFLPHRRKHYTGAGNGLLNGLTNWWDLDEVSGDAIAQAGGVDLTDTNTVGYSAGGAPDGGNSRLFTTANNEMFSASGLLGSGTDITLAIWFKSSTGAGTKYIFGHNAPNGATYLGLFGAAGSEYLQLVFDGGVSRRSPTNLIGTSWHSVVVTSTGPGGVDKMYLDTTECTVVASDKGWEPGTATYYLGANHLGQTATRWDGLMASHGIWDRVFDAADVAAFHNAGVNLRHADLTS